MDFRKSQRKARLFGQTFKQFQNFIELCHAGERIQFHSTDFVAVDRKTWEELNKRADGSNVFSNESDAAEKLADAFSGIFPSQRILPARREDGIIYVPEVETTLNPNDGIRKCVIDPMRQKFYYVIVRNDGLSDEHEEIIQLVPSKNVDNDGR